MAVVNISTIEGTGGGLSTSWRVMTVSIVGSCISTVVMSGDDP